MFSAGRNTAQELKTYLDALKDIPSSPNHYKTISKTTIRERPALAITQLYYNGAITFSLPDEIVSRVQAGMGCGPTPGILAAHIYQGVTCDGELQRCHVQLWSKIVRHFVEYPESDDPMGQCEANTIRARGKEIKDEMGALAMKRLAEFWENHDPSSETDRIVMTYGLKCASYLGQLYSVHLIHSDYIVQGMKLLFGCLKERRDIRAIEAIFGILEVVCQSEQSLRPPKKVAENYSKTLQDFEKSSLSIGGAFPEYDVKQARNYLQKIYALVASL